MQKQCVLICMCKLEKIEIVVTIVFYVPDNALFLTCRVYSHWIRSLKLVARKKTSLWVGSPKSWVKVVLLMTFKSMLPILDVCL